MVVVRNMSGMAIVDATRSYEDWLGLQTPLFRPALDVKHRKMAADPFSFLRGTFYRWLQVWPTACSSLVDAPRVLAVGDVHVENFGTWRDEEGRLIWGLNDLDEACELPYVHDLVRLGTSAALASQTSHMRISIGDACRSILDGYAASLEIGGRPIVLAERHRWLRQIAIEELRDPIEFWRRLRLLPPARARDAQAVLREAMPAAVEGFSVARRVVGTGSLGRRRFVAIGGMGGSAVAREAIALVPSAASWLGERRRGLDRRLQQLSAAVRAPDPFVRVIDGWLVRRLAPDCIKIDVSRLPRSRDDRKLLRAMGWETANVHLQPGNRARLTRDLMSRRGRWLERAVDAMRDQVVRDWREWRNAYRRAGE
jgi:hypothetical protein